MVSSPCVDAIGKLALAAATQLDVPKASQTPELAHRSFHLRSLVREAMIFSSAAAIERAKCMRAV
jgi:hypothetical protein